MEMRSSKAHIDELHYSFVLELSQLFLVVSAALVIGVEIGGAQRSADKQQKTLRYM